MAKKSKGITVMGIFLIVVGLRMAFTPFMFFMMHEGPKPYILNATKTAITNMEREVASRQLHNSENYKQIKMGLEKIRDKLNMYESKRQPLILIVCFILSTMRAVMAILAGILILKLKNFGRLLALWSVAIGFVGYIVSIIYSFFQTQLLFDLVDKISAVSSLIRPDYKPFSFSTQKFFLSAPMSNAILGHLLSYLIFSVIIIYFLTRPKIKSQFQT